MAVPRPEAALVDVERTRRQGLSHPLARGLTGDDARAYLAVVPERRFPRTAYAQRGRAPCIQPRGGVPLFEAQQALTQAVEQLTRLDAKVAVGVF